MPPPLAGKRAEPDLALAPAPVPHIAQARTGDASQVPDFATLSAAPAVPGAAA